MSTETPPNESPNPANETPANQPPSGDWTSGLSDELKNFVQTKGFKDPTSVLDSYRNFEKLMGAPKERLMTLPEKADDPAWGDVYKRLGRPEKPEDYSLEKFKGEGNEELVKWARGAFHEMNLTAAQAEKFAEKWAGLVQERNDASVKSVQEKLAAQEASLKKEWGQAYEQKVKGAKAAAEAFGMNVDQINALERALGYDGVFKFLDSIQTKIGEGNFTAGDKKGGGFGALSPGQAQARINDLMQDEAFSNRYLNGDMEAKAEMDRLHKMVSAVE